MQNTIDSKVQKPPRSYERTAWRWMRYSGILVIPLAFIHVWIQDVQVTVYQIDVDYVAVRWSSLGWRIYDAFLLVFAFTHGVNGLSQVLMDFFHKESLRRFVSQLLFVFWLLVSLAGAIALIAGVRS